MSQENVEAFRRATDAYNRRDVEALLDEAHPEVEWHPVIMARLEGDTTVYRGHGGIRNLFRDMEGAFAELRTDYPDIREVGDLILAIGSVHARGRESGAEIESSVASVIEFRDGKAIRVQPYLDPEDALEAAGLSE